MYRLIFIDEEKDAIDAFKDYIDESQTDKMIEVKAFYPLKDLDEMIGQILKENPDALVTDYNLNEKKTEIKYNVGYDGVELAQKYLNLREDFPVFITTSYADTAIQNSENVNIVYIKPTSEDEKASKVKFIDRLTQQILHYQSKLNNAEVRLKELLEQATKRDLNEKEESELLRLDRIIENSIDKLHAIPEELKTMSNSRRVSQLIEKVDKLLQKIDR